MFIKTIIAVDTSELLSVLEDMFSALGQPECLSNPQAPSSDSRTALCSMHSLRFFSFNSYVSCLPLLSIFTQVLNLQII